MEHSTNLSVLLYTSPSTVNSFSSNIFLKFSVYLASPRFETPTFFSLNLGLEVYKWGGFEWESLGFWWRGFKERKWGGEERERGGKEMKKMVCGSEGHEYWLLRWDSWEIFVHFWYCEFMLKYYSSLILYFEKRKMFLVYFSKCI